MLGTQNESLIFPILQLIQKEMQRAVETRSIDFTGNQYINVDNSINKNVTYSDVKSALDSNDYELTFIKDDGVLQAVKLVYTQKLYELISLIRDNGKLVAVKDSLVAIVDEVTEKNPLGMNDLDFIEYCNNKQLAEDPTTPAETVAELKERNQDLRDLYGILTDDYSYEDLYPYLQGDGGVVDKVLLSILVRLNYDGEGKLTGVTSETLVEEV